MHVGSDAGDVPVAAVIDRRLQLSGLEEGEVWKAVASSLDLGDETDARSVLGYAFTEMLNNAIDHSGGISVRIRFWRFADVISFEVTDDGVGAFHRLAQGLGLARDMDAVGEMSKGKRTTAPAAHTGEGIFFTSKAVTVFRLRANGLEWVVDNRRDDHALGTSDVVQGTTVAIELDIRSARPLAEITKPFSDEDTAFVRSRPVVKLFAHGVEFVSRSEAKRLLAGMDVFSEVEVDFAGVTSVGQGFVDELVRVWPNAHPGTAVVPTNMNEPVTYMVQRGLTERDRSARP